MGQNYVFDEETQTVTFNIASIDAKNYMQIEESLIHDIDEKQLNKLTFDISKVTYMSSAGLRMLAGVNARLQELGGCISVKNASSDLFKLIQLTGYADAFKISKAEV